MPFFCVVYVLLKLGTQTFKFCDITQIFLRFTLIIGHLIAILPRFFGLNCLNFTITK